MITFNIDLFTSTSDTSPLIRHFLNISINFPGNKSNHLAWGGSGYKIIIEKEGFLVALLFLFGDNAYINSAYLGQDDYNFYHSQLRINIECAFGMVVMRWAILTGALSSHYGLKKQKNWWDVCAVFTIFVLMRTTFKDGLLYEQWKNNSCSLDAFQWDCAIVKTSFYRSYLLEIWPLLYTQSNPDAVETLECILLDVEWRIDLVFNKFYFILDVTETGLFLFNELSLIIIVSLLLVH